MAFTDNLVDWWDLAEASGNAVGAHAGIVLTDNNGVGSGTLGGRAARDFESSLSQYLAVNDSAALSLGADTAFTLAIRAQWESTPSSGLQVLLSKDNASGANREFTMYWIDGTRLTFGVWDSVGTFIGVDHTGGNPSVATPYTIIAWHDPVADVLAVSIDDGAPQTVSYSAGTRDTAAPFQIGAGLGVSVNHFDGLIGSVAYWKRVLTSAERTAYYNSGAGLAYTDIRPRFILGTH